MTVATPPWAIQASSHPASAVRQSLQGIFGSPFGSFAGGVSPTTARGGHGVIGATDLAVTANGTPNMSVNVAGGLAVIRGTEAAAQGCYGPGYNDATVNLAIAAADAANPRNDLIVLKARDAQYSGASNDLSLAVVTGTPAAGSPVDPSPPANSIVLARVRVDAAVASIVSGKITDLRQRAWTVGGSGISTAALITSSPAQGDQWYVTDAAVPTGAVAPQTSGRPNAPGLYRYDQRWNPPWNLPWGVMGENSAVANQTTISAEADLTSLSVVFTAVANRRLKITLHVRSMFSASVDQGFTASICNAANTHLNEHKDFLTGSGEGTGGFDLVHRDSPAAGSMTYKGRLARTFGAGTITVEAALGYPAFILVEDIGPNGQPA